MHLYTKRNHTRRKGCLIKSQLAKRFVACKNAERAVLPVLLCELIKSFKEFFFVAGRFATAFGFFRKDTGFLLEWFLDYPEWVFFGRDKQGPRTSAYKMTGTVVHDIKRISPSTQ